MKFIFLKFIGLLLLVNISQAEVVDNNQVSLFTKCFIKLTQSFPGVEEKELLNAVANGQDPIDTCLQLLQEAKLAPSEDKTEYHLKDNSSDLAKIILNNFNDLHFSWFSNNTIPSIGNGDIGGRSIFDHQASALYFTRALFAEDIKFSSIFSHNRNLAGKRKPIAPYTAVTSPYSREPRSNYLFSSNDSFQFAERGELTGIKDISPNLEWPWSFENNNGTIKSGIAKPGKHFGGGLLGSRMFLMTSTQIADIAYKSDGGVILPRTWARYLISDVLCREIPVIRPEDVDNSPNNEKLVVTPQEHPNAPPFRNSRSCARCHATIDRMSYAIRGYSAEHHANFKQGNVGGRFVKLRDMEFASSLEFDWKVEPNNNFYNDNKIGATYYFRESDGELIDEQFADLDQLGNILINTMAPYTCIAKRYFDYLVGDNVIVDDIGYNNLESSLSEADKEKRNFVLNLGKSLKNDNKQNVIEKIISPILKSKYFLPEK